MRELAKDSWIQLFAALTLVSGGVAAVRRASPGMPPAAPAIAFPAPVNTRGDTASAVSPPQAAEASPMIRNLRARLPGRWLVDAARGVDADTDSIAEAVNSAVSGDQIRIRAGRYRENLRVDKDLAFLGEGGAAEDVVIDGGGREALSVDSSEVVLRRLTLANSGEGAALAVSRARLNLTEVAFRPGPSGAGLAMDGGSVSAAECRWEGGKAGLTAMGGAMLKLSGGVLSKLEEGVSVMGDGSSAELVLVKVQGGKNGLVVQRGGRLKADSPEIKDLRECAFKASDKDSMLTVTQARVSGNGKGACVMDSARASFSDSAFFDNARHALVVEGSAEASAEKSTFLRNGRPAVSVSGRGSVHFTDVSVSKNKAVAIALAGGSRAALERVKLEDNVGEGVAIKEGSRLEGTSLDVLGNESCGVIVQDAGSIVLVRSHLNGNLCGIALYRGGNLDITGSDLTNNQRGPLLYKESFNSEIDIRGSGNIPNLR